MPNDRSLQLCLLLIPGSARREMPNQELNGRFAGLGGAPGVCEVPLLCRQAFSAALSLLFLSFSTPKPDGFLFFIHTFSVLSHNRVAERRRLLLHPGLFISTDKSSFI